MRNIPNFTCPSGGAQLILQQLPQTGTAYCLVQWAVPGQLPSLLDEVRRFCRMIDASRVLALAESFGDGGKEVCCPAAFQLLQMEADREQLAPGNARLLPVEKEQWQDYMDRYNMAMAEVDGARLLSAGDAKMGIGSCYFVYQQDTLIGLGQVKADQILSLAALMPGAGGQVLCALASVIPHEKVRLTVASTNHRALRLYERLGFQEVGVAEHWVLLQKGGCIADATGAPF